MSDALFVGSFPPRQCGIATFTNDLVESYDAHMGSRAEVVAIDDRSGRPVEYGPRVVARLREDDPRSYDAAARLINEHPASVVNIQHEYGLFGGPGGVWSSELVGAIHKPVVLTMHTVLPAPTEEHASLARSLVRRSARVVVLSETAKRLLVKRYGMPAEKIGVIHHGVPDVSFSGTADAKAALGFGGRPVISTFGLLSAGKGIEYVIGAVHEIVHQYPDVLYLLIGATHPNVVAAEGERYRESLRGSIAALGLERNVNMVDRYLGLDELLEYLRATDVYVTPYLNVDQVVSGTLAYALAAGKAIVSTPYLYARELLADGRGMLAEFRDSHSLATNVSALLDQPDLRARVELAAYGFAREMTWPRVAAQYAETFSEVRTSALVA